MIKKVFASILLTVFCFNSAVSPATVFSQSIKEDVCAGVTAASGEPCNESSGGASVSKAVEVALRILQVVAGVLAVFYLISSGIKFITSQGSSDGVKSAKNTIIYTAIGIVVVLISQAIIQFVLARFNNPA